MNPLLIRLLPYLAAIGIAGGALWWHSSKVDSFGEVKVEEGRDEIQAKWDKEKAEQMAAHLQAAVANTELIADLEIKHAKVTKELERLRATPAVRVRLPKATCPDLPIPASGVAISITSPKRASDPAQDALGEAQQGMESDAIEWAKSLNACQVVMDWAKSLKPEAR
jgi:hypothetical protein